MKLKIDSEYECLLPPLTRQEFGNLRSSIKENGQLNPIIVNSEGVILDGVHRFKVCSELGLKPKWEVKSFANRLLEKSFVIEVNLSRRHLNDFQKAELAMSLLEIEKQLAKQRQEATIPKKGEKGFQSVSSSNELNVKGQARDIVARKVGLSPTTFYRAEKIIEGGNDYLKKQVRDGQRSITSGYKKLKRTRKEGERQVKEHRLEDDIRALADVNGFQSALDLLIKEYKKLESDRVKKFVKAPIEKLNYIIKLWKRTRENR